MNIVRFTFTVLLSASVLCAILLSIYSYKRRTMPGAKYFIYLLFSTIIYNSGYIGEINSNKLPVAMLWFNFEHIAIPFLHYFWVIMSLEYIGTKKKTIKIARYGLLYHPILYLLIFFTNPIHHFYITSIKFISNGYFHIITYNKEILYMLAVASGTLLALITMGTYIYGYIKASSVHRYAYITMIIASLFPWFSVYIVAANKNYLGVDYFPVVIIISGVLYIFGIFKFRMFNTIPIATETVFRESKKGILLVDLTGHIVDANYAMLEMYPELNKLSKYTFHSFIEAHFELKDFLEEKSKTKYQLMINGQIRHYFAYITKILTDEGIQIGKILAIKDITLFVEYEKSLKLAAELAMERAEINEMYFLQAQIKPHFFNNTLSVIASMITIDPNEARELIVKFSEYLTRAYTVKDTSGMLWLEEELDAINTYVAIEKARFRERLNFEIICEKLPRIKLPKFVLEALVENAIRHGILKKAEGGNVYLKISCDEYKVYFEVKDDGVGIPEEKIELLINGQEKNQGIGIVNIQKRLIKFYGEGLKIKSTVGEGTTVSFYVKYNDDTLIKVVDEDGND